MKTIKCPECSAEQAISRNDDGTMNCMFCGAAITDLPPVDESELLENTDSYENDDANMVETAGEPIKADFVLSRDEVETALTVSGKLKSRKYILWVETALLGVGIFGAIFSIISGLCGWFDMQKPNANSYIFLVLFIALIPAVWIMPKRTKNRILDRAATGIKVNAAVYENLIELNHDGDDPWQLMFDNRYTLIHESGVMVLVIDGGQLVVIPERAFDENELDEAVIRITNGSANRL